MAADEHRGDRVIDRTGQVWEEIGSDAVVVVLRSVSSRRYNHVQHHLLYLIHERKGDSADEWSEFPGEPWDDDRNMRRIA